MLGPSSWRIGCVGGDGQEDGRWTNAAGRAGAGDSRSYGAGEETRGLFLKTEHNRLAPTPGINLYRHVTGRASGCTLVAPAPPAAAAAARAALRALDACRSAW